MRQRYCRVCGGWHDVDAWNHNCLPPEPVARSTYPAPFAISDVMDAVQSMASGKVYDSKSAIRSEYRHLGYVEVGNDAARKRQKERRVPDRQGIRDSLKKAKERVAGA